MAQRRCPVCGMGTIRVVLKEGDRPRCIVCGLPTGRTTKADREAAQASLDHLKARLAEPADAL